MNNEPNSQTAGAKPKSRGATPYGKVLNPLTNRYVKASGQVAKNLVKKGVFSGKPCGKGKVLNTKTNRCVKEKVSKKKKSS